jgi:hypothetical protein
MAKSRRPRAPAPAKAIAPTAPVKAGKTAWLACKVFGQRFLPIWGLTLPSVIPIGILFVIDRLAFSGHSPPPVLIFGQVVIGFLAFMTPFSLQCSVAAYVHGRLKDAPPAYHKALAGGLERFSVVLSLLMALALPAFFIGMMSRGILFVVKNFFGEEAMIGSGIVMIIIGFFLLAPFCASLAVSGVERRTALNSLFRSISLIRKNYLSVVLILLPLVLICFSCGKYISSIYDLISHNIVLIFLLLTLTTVPLSFVAAVLAVIYCQLKIAEESDNFAMESQVFDQAQF